jgi:hypothetical protein
MHTGSPSVSSRFPILRRAVRFARFSFAIGIAVIAISVGNGDINRNLWTSNTSSAGIGLRGGVLFLRGRLACVNRDRSRPWQSGRTARTSKCPTDDSGLGYRYGADDRTVSWRRTALLPAASSREAGALPVMRLRPDRQHDGDLPGVRDGDGRDGQTIPRPARPSRFAPSRLASPQLPRARRLCF